MEVSSSPAGPVYATIMGSGPQNHNRDVLLGPSSIKVPIVSIVVLFLV